MHIPSQALAFGIHTPAHTFIPVGHAVTQARPLQVTDPPVGIWQAMHDALSLGPQVATALLSTQVLPQT
jgi:hypothetical protein